MNAGVPSQQFAPPPYVDKTRWEKFVDVLRDLRLLVQPWWDRCSAIHKLLSYLAVIPIFTLFSLLIFTLCCSVATPLYSGIKYEMVSLGITIGDGVTYVGGSIGDGFGAVGNGLSTFGDVLAASLNYGKPDANSMNLAEYIGKQTDAIQTIDELESILWEGDSDMIATYIPHEAIRVLGRRSKIGTDAKEQASVRAALLSFADDCFNVEDSIEDVFFSSNSLYNTAGRKIKTVVSKLKPLRAAWFPSMVHVQESIGDYLDHVISNLEIIEGKIDVALQYTAIAMERLDPVTVKIDAIHDHFFRSTLDKEPTSLVSIVIRNVFDVFGYKEKPRFVDPLIRRNLTRSQQALAVLGGMGTRLTRARKSVGGLRKAVLEFRSSAVEDQIRRQSITIIELDDFIEGMEAMGKLWATRENLYEQRQNESEVEFMARLKEVCSRETDQEMSLCGLLEDEVPEDKA